MYNPFPAIGNFVDHLIPSNTVSYTAPPLPPPPTTNKISDAIAENETGGVPTDRYAFSRPSGNASLGRAMGKYQVTEGQLKSYAKRYLGASTTAEQFQNTPALQDRYIMGKIKYLSGEGYTPAQIADIHRNGTTGGPPGSTKYLSPAYVANFLKHYQGTTTPQTLTSTAK